MPSSRFQVYKGMSMEFCFKCGLLQKKAKAHDLPTVCSASLWLFGENTGKVRLVFSRRSWLQCCETHTGENRTRVEHSALSYLVAVLPEVHLTDLTDLSYCPSFGDPVQQQKSTLLI